MGLLFLPFNSLDRLVSQLLFSLFGRILIWWILWLFLLLLLSSVLSLIRFWARILMLTLAYRR